jgi:hypothetical protein
MISMMTDHSFIDDEGRINIHVFDSMTGFSSTLIITETISAIDLENHFEAKSLLINNKKSLSYTFNINVRPKTFSDFRIIFLMGLVWKIDIELADDLTASDLMSIKQESKFMINEYSLSYQSTNKTLKSISNDLYSLKDGLSRLSGQISSVKNLIYILLALIVVIALSL